MRLYRGISRSFARIALAAVAALLCSGAAMALFDTAGARDHPLFRRPSGYVIVSYSQGHSQGGSASAFPELSDVAFSGKQTDILYRTEGRPLTGAELMTRFINALAAAGGELVTRENPLLGGQRAVGVLRRPGRDVWVMQEILSLRSYRLAVAETGTRRTELPSVPVSADIYEEEARALDLLYRLERDGRLEFPVRFALGSDIPLKGYEADFQRVVRMMRKDSQIHLRVDAWTDDTVRSVETGVQLRARRMALIDALVRMGADAKRLTAASSGEETQPPRGVVRLSVVDPSSEGLQMPLQ